jgi:hypothetical protein
MAASTSTANASIGNEGNEVQYKELVIEITQMLKSCKPPFYSLSPGLCIYKVPRHIRELNEKVYTPTYISIGPFHRGNKNLKTMEKFKVNYFKIFVKKAALNVEELVSTIKDWEQDVRGCYAENGEKDVCDCLEKNGKITSDDYVKMIMLDASFIIVFFLNWYRSKEWKNDDEFTILTPQLKEDMLLLENQLPFFVIEKLYSHAFPSWSNYPSFIELAFKFFKGYNTQDMPPNPNLKIKHFVDLLRTFFLPEPQKLPQRKNGEKVKHLFTASQLHEVGMKFKDSLSKCKFDLKFKNGVLEIPCFDLDYSTERFFRNIMTLEQFHYRSDHYVSDYVRILDFLIDTSKDVDLLVRKRILNNTLGDSNAATTVVNNLNKCTFYLDTNSDYYRLCKNLKSSYKKRLQYWKLKATLRRDYCSNLWRTIATIAAIILLGLTLTQTICSIMSVPKN